MWDFEIQDHGSIMLLAPISTQAVAWIDDNLPPERMEWAGAVAIEPRYLEPIVQGILDAGLTVR